MAAIAQRDSRVSSRRKFRRFTSCPLRRCCKPLFFRVRLAILEIFFMQTFLEKCGPSPAENRLPVDEPASVAVAALRVRGSKKRTDSGLRPKQSKCAGVTALAGAAANQMVRVLAS